ncbi:MAG: hypothetical protein KC589_09530 [Nanoarchaeota archaeon]|nr:hypothetical protein [Nanoarchaeota archaeon]
MKKSKSQIFLFDLIFSTVILVVSIAIVMSYYTDTVENIDIHDLNSQILNSFTKTKINSLNSEEVRQMFIDNEIKNIKNTVAQQVSEFYYLGKIDRAENLTLIFVGDYINKQMNFNITLQNSSGSVISLFEAINLKETPFDESSISSVSERIVYGFINSSDFYGPFLFKVELWK